jgi:hypothetical protein
MIRKSLMILLVGMSASSVSFAQKIRLIEGDLKALRDQTSVKTEFTYDDMIIGKDESEKDYIAEKKRKFDDKEAGRGAKWEKAWYADRKDRFEPLFRELFAKHSGVSTVGENAQYTMIFKTTRTEPGWNVGVMKQPAFIDGEAWFVETANPSKVIAKVTIRNSPGRSAWGMDFETGARLQEAYAKAGKELGGFFKKQRK